MQLPLTLEQHGFGLHGFIYVWAFSFPITTATLLVRAPRQKNDLAVNLPCSKEHS